MKIRGRGCSNSGVNFGSRFVFFLGASAIKVTTRGPSV